MVHIDFYFDFISPFSYMAAMRLPRFEQEHGVTVNWQPFLLPQLIKLAGNVPPSTIPKKGLYLLRDLQRWAAFLDVPFKMQNPPFFDARPALCAARALDGDERERFSLAVFRRLWGGGFRPDHEGWLQEILRDAGLPGEWARPGQPDDVLMAQLEQATAEAFRLGAFGAPSFFLYGGGKPQLYWGVDRMDFLARAADALRARTVAE